MQHRWGTPVPLHRQPTAKMLLPQDASANTSSLRHTSAVKARLYRRVIFAAHPCSHVTAGASQCHRVTIAVLCRCVVVAGATRRSSDQVFRSRRVHVFRWAGNNHRWYCSYLCFVWSRVAPVHVQIKIYTRLKQQR